MEMTTASREEWMGLVLRRRALIEELEARIAELEAARGEPRGMPGDKIEPKSPPKPKGERKERERNFARERDQSPDERVEHGVDRCPDCGTGLGGGSVKRTREVIEVRPNPATVIEHVYIERRRPICEERYTPEADLGGVVVGRGRLGVSLVALIARLRERGRLPIATIE